MNEELLDLEKKMTTNSHNRGSKEDHSRRRMKKEVAKANGKRMIQEEFDREKDEIGLQI